MGCGGAKEGPQSLGLLKEQPSSDLELEAGFEEWLLQPWFENASCGPTHIGVYPPSSSGSGHQLEYGFFSNQQFLKLHKVNTVGLKVGPPLAHIRTDASLGGSEIGDCIGFNDKPPVIRSTSIHVALTSQKTLSVRKFYVLPVGARTLNLIGSVDHPAIPDEFITASSQSDVGEPHRVRAESDGSWSVGSLKGKHWIAFQFKQLSKVHAIETWGRDMEIDWAKERQAQESFGKLFKHREPEWVTQYKVDYKTRALGEWTEVPQVFEGNVDADLGKVNHFEPPLIAFAVRVRPTAWNNGVSMRVELMNIEMDPPVVGIQIPGFEFIGGRMLPIPEAAFSQIIKVLSPNDQFEKSGADGWRALAPGTGDATSFTLSATSTCEAVRFYSLKGSPTVARCLPSTPFTVGWAKGLFVDSELLPKMLQDPFCIQVRQSLDYKSKLDVLTLAACCIPFLLWGGDIHQDLGTQRYLEATTSPVVAAQELPPVAS